MQWKVAVFSPVLRLGIIPLVFLATAYFLPITTELKRVIVVQAAMPSAVFNIMIARLYGGHASTAVQVVMATTVVSCATTPLVIAWGLKLVGA
jgi:predicted permease